MPANADNSYLSQLQLKAKQEILFNDHGWHALLHYKPKFFGGYQSQTSDEKFFNDVNGMVSPEAELNSTIAAFFENGEGDNHPQCRFPARYHWLNKKLSFDALKLKKRECPELEKWHVELKPHSMDLIFPAAFINGPSSMFGHTLLRVNSHDFRKDLPLVSYALNYAANADATDNALFFSFKGLIGGYPGVFSIVPYYEKLNEYRDIENRDIWEYSLNFTQQEVEQLLRHTWELRYINFAYYYITENCSYHILSLMEVARPGLKLTHLFDTKAIPVDTVRAVINAQLVDQVNYRPSTTTTINHRATELGDEANGLVINLTKGALMPDDDSLKTLDPDTYARTLEQAYDYSRYLSTEDPSKRDIRAKKNWSLLVARSETNAKQIWGEIPVPSVRPDKSHKTARLSLGLGELAEKSFVSLKLRPAYHDLVDPPEGYAPASQINFLDLQLRYFDDTKKLRLDRLTVINVLSLPPRDNYFDPISWGVDFSIERTKSLQGQINVAQLTIDGGYSYALGRAWIFSTLLETKIKAADKLTDNYSAGLGLRLNLLCQNKHYSTQLTLKSMAFRAGEEIDYRQAKIEQSFHFSMNESMRLVAVRSKEYNEYSSQVVLSMNWHY